MTNIEAQKGEYKIAKKIDPKTIGELMEKTESGLTLKVLSTSIDTANVQKGIVEIFNGILTNHSYEVLKRMSYPIFYEIKMMQNQLYKTLISNDISIEVLNKKSSSMEDYFLSLISGDEENEVCRIY